MTEQRKTANPKSANFNKSCSQDKKNSTKNEDQAYRNAGTEKQKKNAFEPSKR